MACLFTWARALRESAPLVVIAENVPRFPVSLLESLFDDMYDVECVVFDAKDAGSPGRRRRLYAVMCLRDVFG